MQFELPIVPVVFGQCRSRQSRFNARIYELRHGECIRDWVLLARVLWSFTSTSLIFVINQASRYIGTKDRMSQVCKYVIHDDKRNPFSRRRRGHAHYITLVKRNDTFVRIVGLWVTTPAAIIRRARRAMLMNIDTPCQYAPLEVNALALLTLWSIESRGPARRKRKYP